MTVSCLASFRRRGFIRVLALAAAVLLGAAVPGVLAPPASAADAPGVVTRPLAPSNTALLARAALSAARRLVSRAPLGAGTKVGLRPEGDDKLNADMREAILQALNERRITCVLLPPLATAEGGGGETAAAEEPAATPTGPGGGGPGAASSAGGTLTADTVEPFQALQAERERQAARADSIARASAGDDDVGVPDDRSGGPSRTEEPMPVLTWRVQEARVDYVRQFRGGLFGSPRVERRARVDLALRLTPAGSDAITWSASADSTVGDVVHKSELAALEDRTRPETRPQLPTSSFKKVLEPALVVVLIAGLVSLFYQNRP